MSGLTRVRGHSRKKEKKRKKKEKKKAYFSSFSDSPG